MQKSNSNKSKWTWFGHVKKVEFQRSLEYLDTVTPAVLILGISNIRGYHTLVLEIDVPKTMDFVEIDTLVWVCEYHGHIVEVRRTDEKGEIVWKSAEDLETFPAGWNAKHDVQKCQIDDCTNWAHFYAMSYKSRELYLWIHANQHGCFLPDGRYARHIPSLNGGSSHWERVANEPHRVVYLDLSVHACFVMLTGKLYHLRDVHGLATHNVPDGDIKKWAKTISAMGTFRGTPKFVDHDFGDGRETLFDVIVQMGIWVEELPRDLAPEHQYITCACGVMYNSDERHPEGGVFCPVRGY